MVLLVVLLQDVLHVVRDLVDLEREEQRLGLEIARLQNEQHPTCQAVVAIVRDLVDLELGLLQFPAKR